MSKSPLNEAFFTLPPPFSQAMIVRAEPLWEEQQGEEDVLKGWMVCVEFPRGREECFTVRQLYINGELEKDPPYTVYFFEATEVRLCEDEAEVYG